MNKENNIRKPFDYFSMIQLLKIYKRFMLLFISISLVLILAWSYIMPHTYESTSSMLPPKQNESGGGLSTFLQSFSGGGMVLGGMGQSNQSQVFGEVLKSRSVAKYLTDTLRLYELPDFRKLNKADIYNAVRSMIDVQVQRTGLILVTASAKTGFFPSSLEKRKAAELSSLMANCAVDGLDKIMRTKNVSSAKRTRMYIEGELVNYSKKLDSVEVVLSRFKQDHKVLALTEQTKAILGQAISTGAELTKAEIDLTIARQDFSPASPNVKTYEKLVSALKDQYSKIQTGGLTSTDAFSIPLQKVPELERVYTNLVRDQKILEQVILYLETQRHQEAIQEEKDIPIVETLDQAIPPNSQSSPARKLLLAAGLLLSFFFAMIIVYIRAYYAGKKILPGDNQAG